MIICPNPSCQTPNPIANAHCRQCRAVIPHRYLWAVGLGDATDVSSEDTHGDLSQALAEWPWSERYQYLHSRIFLDTQPGKAPEAEPDFPDFVLPYLYLSGYRLQVPRPYALLPYHPNPILLLEDAALRVESPKAPPTVLPTLDSLWSSASPLRQLHWLWQIVQLWHALEAEQVVGSLLNPELLRVDGSIVQLLELSTDNAKRPPALADLGKAWSPLAAESHETIRDFLVALCKGLQTKRFETAERLVICLDQALTWIGAGQGIDCELAMMSDKGPTRERNEDACYPVSGATERSESKGGEQAAGKPLMMVVCDGIGGHQGGDVASKLAIATVQQKLKPILTRPDLDSVTVTLAIERAICAANDEISQQNDQEDRYARDRMGTTLVMALVLGPHLYIANIGDSRAYRINHHSCHQVTLDDDVASREVRLGYGFYREVVDHPGAGALVQALGMHNSQTLYPNVQRFTLDEDSLFLLCSDGLSDSDRVEQFWQTELLPVFKRKHQVSSSVKNLIQIANTYNGHDNVTVGLMRCHVTRSNPRPVPATMADPNMLPKVAPPEERLSGLTTAKTVLAAPPAAQPVAIWPLILGILGLGGLAAALTAFFFFGPSPRPAVGPFSEQTLPPGSSAAPPTTSPPPIQSPTPASQAALTPGSYATIQPEAASVLTLKVNPKEEAGTVETENASAQLTSGTLVQVLGKQESADQARWVQLKVCTGGNTENAGEPKTTPPTTGWLLESQLAPVAIAVEDGFIPPPGACDLSDVSDNGN